MVYSFYMVQTTVVNRLFTYTCLIAANLYNKWKCLTYSFLLL
jgi:hypothetical protein